MPISHESDRNLLFGIFALQVNFISRDALVAAMHAWVLDKKKSLGQVLREQGRLTAGQLQALDALLVEHLQAHGDDAERSLAALPNASIVRSTLAEIDDADLQASVARFASRCAGDHTVNYRPPPSNGTRYRRRAFHKAGGLGEVYFAEDTELHREVALKEIRPERADDPESRGRFIIEAEITGGLEHPGIVPVYGLGAYENGRPYYAMRFIRGDNLKEAIERFHAADKPGRDASERSLAFRQLLRRYVDVCNAVAYAHSRGVLHRDLKPANVMLGKYGETLVVDWGLAKAGIRAADHVPGVAGADEPTLRPSSGSSAEATQAGFVIGTVGFMSPEQAAGRINDLTAASDIFSLGATLYVLLTGQRPVTGKDDAEVMAKIRRGEFQPPRSRKPGTPPALDAICRKAMALKPAGRYATALELAGDVEHWLADEPVAAYPEPWTMRAGRWARRHRTALVGTAVFLVSAVFALSISTGLIWSEQQKTAAQKQIAEENYLAAREQLLSSIDLIETSEVDFAAIPALFPKRRAILHAATNACRQALDQKPDDPEMRKRSALVYHYAANFHRLTDETDQAGPLYQDSIRLYDGLTEQHPKTSDYPLKLAEIWRDYSTLQAKLGEQRQAGDSLEHARKLIEELRAKDPKRLPFGQPFATILLNQSANEHAMGKEAEPRKKADQAVKIFRDLVELPPGKGYHPYNRLLLATALNQVAVIERDAGRLQEARALHKEATVMLDDLKEKRPNRVVYADILSSRAWCRLEQARTIVKIGDQESRVQAEENLTRAATQWESLASNYSWVLSHREGRALALQLRGQIRMDDQRFAEARADFDKSREMLEALVKSRPRIPEFHAGLGTTYAGLGRLARREGDQAKSAEWLGKANDALGKAVEQAPDNAQWRKELEGLAK